MDKSDLVISSDYFFTLGMKALLSRNFNDQMFFIVDVETTRYTQVMNHVFRGKKIFAFISNDMDYYALRNIENLTLINRRIPLNEMITFFEKDNSRSNYIVENELSKRESEVLTCMLGGLDTREIRDSLKMNMKVFYAHRTRMIKKLQITNRICLYKTIASNRAIN